MSQYVVVFVVVVAIAAVGRCNLAGLVGLVGLVGSLGLRAKTPAWGKFMTASELCRRLTAGHHAAGQRFLAPGLGRILGHPSSLDHGRPVTTFDDPVAVGREAADMDNWLRSGSLRCVGKAVVEPHYHHFGPQVLSLCAHS
ncbi:hypothetical protein V490_07911 [Pseudogymnoascus sp. VKM F-3557]|nr:hypothetical protein V490_07911 [Pseudogymnoascus sp. VKM F-3557]